MGEGFFSNSAAFSVSRDLVSFDPLAQGQEMERLKAKQMFPKLSSSAIPGPLCFLGDNNL